MTHRPLQGKRLGNRRIACGRSVRIIHYDRRIHNKTVSVILSCVSLAGQAAHCLPRQPEEEVGRPYIRARHICSVI
jgi:hypothetical protein